jgi:hypothetical protein
MSRSPSCLAQTVEERPCKYKRHQTAKQVANPEVADWTEEECASIAFRFEREDQQGDDSCADKVEEEARK